MELHRDTTVTSLARVLFVARPTSASPQSKSSSATWTPVMAKSNSTSDEVDSNVEATPGDEVDFGLFHPEGERDFFLNCGPLLMHDRIPR